MTRRSDQRSSIASTSLHPPNLATRTAPAPAFSRNDGSLSSKALTVSVWHFPTVNRSMSFAPPTAADNASAVVGASVEQQAHDIGVSIGSGHGQGCFVTGRSVNIGPSVKKRPHRTRLVLM